jgi:hypothetical protein
VRVFIGSCRSGLLFLFVTLLLVSCGNDSGGQKNASGLPAAQKTENQPNQPGQGPTTSNISAVGMAGIYRVTSSELVNFDTPYFIITPEKDLYVLKRDQTRYIRDYKGDLNFARYTFNADAFESGSIAGIRMQGNETELSADLQRLSKINAIMSQLKSALNSAGISAGVRLANRHPSFGEVQLAVMEQFLPTENKNALIAFLKSINANVLEASDYTNIHPSLQKGTFDLPGGLVGDPAKLIQGIKDQTIAFDRL